MTSTYVAPAPAFIPPGSNIAVKKYSAALFVQQQRRATFVKSLSAPAPKEGMVSAALRGKYTSPMGMPICNIMDLASGPGDRVGYDLMGLLRGKPIMGDRRLSGRMMNLRFTSNELLIQQTRGGVDPGGVMTRKRTVYDLRTLAMSNLERWNTNLMDNRMLVHLSGARGSQLGGEWTSVPFETDPDFAEIMINPVLPPTYNRRFIVGNPNDGLSGSISSLDSTDVITRTAIERMRAQIDNDPTPIQGITPDSESGEFEDDDENLYVLYVSPAGYNQFRASYTGSGQDYNSLVAAAVTRSSNFKHPAFRLGDLLWQNIIIRRRPKMITFKAGDNVREYNSSGTIVNTPAPVAFDRAILMGAQAAVYAMGSSRKSGLPLDWHEEETDHDARIEISTSMIDGCMKTRFSLDGVETDYGVAVLDHYNGQ